MMHIAKPTPILSSYIKQFWTLRDNNLHKPYLHRIIPSGLHELTFYFEEVPEAVQQDKKWEGRVVLSGQQLTHFDLRIGGNLDIFSISLQPCAIRSLFSIPADKLLNLNIAADEVIGNEIMELADRLSHLRDFNSRIHESEKFFFKKLTESCQNNHKSRVIDSLNLINNQPGTVEINMLANRACLSRKQFERIFSECIGISPGKFLRTIRFQYSLLLLQKGMTKDLTSLSCHAGFFDQAHMIRDFKAFSGMTPGQFVRDCEPVSDYFSGF